MADETKLLAQANRGERAKRILEDPLYVEAFGKIEAELIERFKTSEVSDSDGHRNIRESLKLLNNLQSEFKQIMITGDGARKELLRIREESKLRRMLHGR